MKPRRAKTMPANDRLSGDELVIHIIQRMAQGDLPSELIDPAPHHHRLDHDQHRAGVGLLQIIDGPFTATLDHLTTKPIPMDRDTQIRNYHYDTHPAALDLYGALYDACTAHSLAVRRAQPYPGNDKVPYPFVGTQPGAGGTNAEFERELEYALLDLHDDNASPLLHRLDHGDADTSPILETKWVVSIPGATLTVRRDFEHLHFEYIPREITRRVVYEHSVYDYPEEYDAEAVAPRVTEYRVSEDAIATTFETAYSRIELYNVLRAFLHHLEYTGTYCNDPATAHLEGNDTDLGKTWMFRRALRACRVHYDAAHIFFDDVDELVRDIYDGIYSMTPGDPFCGLTSEDSQHGDNPAVKVHWPVASHWQTWTMRPTGTVKLQLVMYAEPGVTSEYSYVGFGGLIYDAVSPSTSWYTPLVSPYPYMSRPADKLDVLALLHVLASCDSESVLDALSHNVNFLDRLDHREADWEADFPRGWVNVEHETAMKNARAACTGEAASLHDSFMIVAEGVSDAMDKAADTLNKLGDVFNHDEDEKGDFDYEQDV